MSVKIFDVLTSMSKGPESRIALTNRISEELLEPQLDTNRLSAASAMSKGRALNNRSIGDLQKAVLVANDLMDARIVSASFTGECKILYSCIGVSI